MINEDSAPNEKHDLPQLGIDDPSFIEEISHSNNSSKKNITIFE